MACVRFLGAELSYGCHRGSFRLPAKPEPVVVAGPNGAGKSTLIEGLVRTLFGFNRRSAEEGRMFERRQPWDGEDYRGKIELLDSANRRHVLEREFDSTDVAIVSADLPGERWKGDGNPAGTNVAAAQFRERLRALLGFDRLEGYERTAYVCQGGLLGTRLDESLLRAAAGSGIDVEHALTGIERGYRQLTRAPIVEGRGSALKSRRRELMLARSRELEQQLATIREAEQVRGPLMAEQRELQATLDRLDAEIDVLETAQMVLARRRTLEAEIAGVEEQITVLERHSQELEWVRADLRAAEARFEELAEGPRWPDDFTERAAAVQQLWANRDRVEQQADAARRSLGEVHVPGIGWALGGVAVVVGGAAGWLAGWSVPGMIALAAGTVIAALGYGLRIAGLDRQSDRARAVAAADQELEHVAGAIADQLGQVPDADTLTPQTLPERRTAFLQWRAAREARDRARERLSATLRRIAAASGSPINESVDADGTLQELARRVSMARNRRAEQRLQLEESERGRLALPSGVRAGVDEVQNALAARRMDRAGTDRCLREIANQLAENRPSRSPVAVEDELTALRTELGEVEESIDSYRVAYALLDEAHREFRDEDQRRLVDAISGHLQRLSAGELGPLRAPGELADATLDAFGRSVPLDYRPLSYGQFHLALLAVRLGAADFLASWGIRVPLIVDEPFANLDDGNAATVWAQLQTIARERQVIVATQESSLLERLRVRPDIRLG